jgi:hypothetical protein
MAKKLEPTQNLLEGIIARIPEGFVRRVTLENVLKMYRKVMMDKLLSTSWVSRDGNLFFDSRQLTKEQVRELDRWCRPELPPIHKRGHLTGPSIAERLAIREQQVEQADAPDHVRVIHVLKDTHGYAEVADVCTVPGDDGVLQSLLDEGVLRQIDSLVYDPLRLSSASIQEVCHRRTLIPLHQKLKTLLQDKPGHTAPRSELKSLFGATVLRDILSIGGFAAFDIPSRTKLDLRQWVRLAGSDDAEARKVAEKVVAEQIQAAWGLLLETCGEVLRPEAQDGKTNRAQVVARTYTLKKAAKHLELRQRTLEQAINEGQVPSFVDPEGRVRVLATTVEAIEADVDYGERIAALEILKIRDLATVSGASYSTMWKRLKRAGINRMQPQWGQIRGRWNMPETYRDFRETLATRKAEWAAERARQKRLLEEQREEERKRREELRARLVAAFPSWKNDGRIDQKILLHIGPPNSGKTHDALNTLVEAGSGWYLAPLRLLAFEIFDRLNQRGVPCTLLTGEEYIPVEGARIVAATIEMFNPTESGDCVIIDEAQMLADSNRGWAWTRALMEAQAPIIHVIGPSTVQGLVEKLATAAAIPYEVMAHQRLAPIRVADTSWPLHRLPAHTILVAFSRRMVLHLKTELERDKRRVSVVYGSLPPEVRRKQADRFAEGETDICVATDAVGMGLNLPADYVCFFDIEKFDGRKVRLLNPSEVHQIGGRAGRFGFSAAGEIGTTTKKNLRILHRLYESQPPVLTHARVAPTVKDLEMIPGNLGDKLEQWSRLQSIPDSLKEVLQTANMAERIELARMLTDAQVEQLGLAVAVQLTNAPTRQSSRSYWHHCAQAILAERFLPLPPPPPKNIRNSRNLEAMEICISCADIYLWLGHRREFKLFGAEVDQVAADRRVWSARIDEALLQQIDTARRCEECERPLPLQSRFKICDRCHQKRHWHDDY